MLYKWLVGNARSTTRARVVLLFLLLPTALFLNNELIWDDVQVFESHVAWSWHALLGPFLDNIAIKVPYWRPLTVLTLALPQLAGLPVWFNKLISLGLFYVQGCLAIKIADDWFKSREIAVDTMPLISLAVVLALHPIFVEPTMWLSARADLLMGLFVLIAVQQIARFDARQTKQQQPESARFGLLRGFAITWLICGAKDSGILWAALALLVVVFLGANSTNNWRKYWWYWAGGTGIAGASYWVIRVVILSQNTVSPEFDVTKTLTRTESLQRFTEFFIRTFINTFAPLFDPAPFKSSGWMDGYSPILLLAILIGIFCVAGFILTRLYRHNIFAACLITCALIIIFFHAGIEAYSESTLGSVLATRYLAPGNVLIFVALTLLLFKRAPAAANEFADCVSMPIVALFAVVVLQSLSVWAETRLSWSSNFEMWANSWNHGSRTKDVAEGYSASLFARHDYVSSRQIARYWIAKNPQSNMTTRPCKLFENILETDVILQDQEDGIHYATKASPIGWCHPTLARNIAFFLLKDHCELVQSVIYQSIDMGDKPKGSGLWQFKDQKQRNTFLVLAASTEARCGDHDKLIRLLNEVAASDPIWAVDGEKARQLMNPPR